MDENSTDVRSALRTWLKRVGIAFAVLFLLLVAFHRPILQTVARKLAIHFAAQQNLKVDLRVEGSILGGVVLRNVHAAATGPSALQSADIDFVRVDYSLWGLLRHGMSALLKNVEVRNANIVLDPAQAPPVPPPEPNKKFTLPAFFPDRLTLSDVNLRMASTPNDLIVQHLSVELLPDRAGELRIAKLQLASGRAWKDVTAQTTYENRNLYLRNLVLDDGTRLAEVNIDASKIAQNKLDVAVKGTIAGGNVDTTISLGGTKDGAAEMNIDLNVEHTSVDAVRKYLQPAEAAQKRDAASTVAGAAAAAGGAEPTKGEVAASIIPPGVDGDVKKLSVKINGKADQPSSWNGTIAAEIDNLGAAGAKFDHATIDVKAADGRAQINNVQLQRGSNKVTLQGTAELPNTFEGFGHSPATIQLHGDLPALGEITAGLAQPITGSAEVNGQVSVANDTVHADIVIAGGPIDFGQGNAQHVVVKLNAAKVMPPVGTQRPYFDQLTADVGLDVTDLRAKDYAIDSVHGQLHSVGADLQVQELVAKRAENEVTLSGRYQLPEDFARAAEQPATVDFSLAAPHLAALWTGEALVTGALQGSGRLNYQQQLGDGYFQIFGSNLRAQNLTVPQLNVQGTTANNTVYLNDLRAQMNAHDSIAAHGQVVAKAPYAYSGALDVSIANLATLDPILKAAGKPTELGGALAINWHGDGTAGDFKSHGKLDLNLTNGRYADLRKLEAKIDASYTPEELDVPIVFLSSDKVMFQAIMQAKGQTLEVTKIEIDQGQAKYATGYISVPFIWANVGTEKPLFPADGKVLVNIKTENLEIQKLAKDLGTTAPVSGLANLKVDAQGTLRDLHAAIDLQLTGLKSDQLKDFTPATFGLNARIENNQLTVSGKLEQARISPVQITANMPLNVAHVLEQKKLSDDTPISAKVQMPRSSINFVRQFVPALERVDGTLALDVNVGGTLGKPRLSGNADAAIVAARFANPSVPAITNFNARLTFTEDRVELQQFKGELAGGPFTLSGRITFPKITEPNFDLQLRADAVLVARNDNLTVRTDANVRVTGPLNSASVTGDVALTNSQFLKNLDLIPIGVPGRPPPAPQPPSDSGGLSFPNPPLRDWKFDVAIKTKDPFKIRGNLANGGAIVDMRLTGTGEKPIINGSVRLQNVEVTLPFSRLEITQG
ncbi:MAG: translocation/assembly module TamB domain-containing protein, partial [Verrucomicrobiota bacterium]|nr:translocation/assembly module TamB domain-containing protein [Verrucomicrobiota bacterium]